MNKINHGLLAFVLGGMVMIGAAQTDGLTPELKATALRDAACAGPGGTQDRDATVSTLSIRAGGHELGTIVAVQGACHCQSNNCDTLVYVRSGQGQRLAFHEKYASLHPMKAVKRGMPSLTGTFEIGPAKAETTVYDWDGKDYRPSLCATVIKGKRVPTIAQHACKTRTP